VLWLVALRNAPQPEPQLLAPFPLLLRAMAASTGARAGLLRAAVIGVCVFAKCPLKLAGRGPLCLPG
jgi:hypothetical protein